MFKHNVSYVDFNGTERKEDLYFHLSLPEVTRIEIEIGKPLVDYTKELSANQDLKELIDFLETFILSAYGEKSADGKTFHKNEEIKHKFEHSQAYAEIFEQMLTNPDLARKFGESVSGKRKVGNNVEPKVVE